MSCGSSRPLPELAGSEYAVASTVMCTRAPQVRVQLVVAVHPDFGQAAHDRMGGLANDDRERHALAVAARGPRHRVRDERVVAVVPIGPRVFVARAPAADAEHLVVGSPAGKRVVGRMHADQSAAAFT